MKTSHEVLARRSRVFQDAARSFDVSLGDPPPERSALTEFLARPLPPEPTVAINPAAAHAARIEREKARAEAARERERIRKAAWRARRKAAGLDDSAARRRATDLEAVRDYERTRKAKWRAQRRASGLAAADRAARRARKAMRKAAKEAWLGP